MDIEAAINWFESRIGKVSYSQQSRKGPGSFDCSSALYYALIQAKVFPEDIYIGNTDTLFNDLERYGFVRLQPNAQGNYDNQRGDVALWGERGHSGGDDGHAMLYENANDIIACSAGYNGIHVNNYDQLRGWNNNPIQTFYRFTGKKRPEVVDQVVNVGSYIRFEGAFTVDDVQRFADVWQVRTNTLCPVNFVWSDNGIPAAPLIEIDNEGFATLDQSFDIGSRYVIPGKFQVLDVGQSYGRWFGKISWNGFTFWVDLEPSTEVGPDDAGTNIPSTRPVTTTTMSLVTTTTTITPATTTTTTKEQDMPETTTTTTAKKQVIPVTDAQFEELKAAGVFTVSEGDSPVVSDKIRFSAYIVAGAGIPTVTVIAQTLAVLGFWSVETAVQMTTIWATFFGSIAGLLGVAHFTKQK